MSRWTCLLPRLILLLILLTIVSLGVDPAMRWALSNAARATSGAALEVRRVSTQLANSTAVIEGVEIGDPVDSAGRMIEVDRAVVKFDPWALARRRLVIVDGKLEGVRINATGGASDCRRDAARPQLASEAESLGAAWQQIVAAQPPQLTKPRSSQLAQQIQQNRTAEFAGIVRRASEWQSRFEELDELTRLVGDNPLRMTPGYRARLEQLSQVGDEIVQLNQQLAALQRQVQQDRMTLEQTRTQELAGLRQNTNLAPVSGAKLSSYLLEDEWAGRIGSWINWVRESRKVANLRSVRPRFAWDNARGVDVQLNAGRHSDFELQNVFLTGSGQVDGRVFRFRGTLQNLSDEPGIATDPAVLTLTAEGDGAIQMDAVLDRSGERPVDRIRIVCPHLPSPRKVWGDPREFAVESGPGVMRMALQLEVEGEGNINGRIDFAQHETELVPSWPGSRREQQANRTIQAVLQEVREVSGHVQLSGTLQHPVWRLESDLGQQVVSRMQDVLRTELAARTEMLVRQYESQSQQQWQQLSDVLGQQEQSAVKLIAAKSSELEQFRNRIAQRTDLMDRLVRNAGPLENLLRR